MFKFTKNFLLWLIFSSFFEEKARKNNALRKIQVLLFNNIFKNLYKFYLVPFFVNIRID